MSNVLTEKLASFSEADWLAALEELLPCVHDVDKNAVQLWFRFFPLDLKRYADAAENREEVVRGLALQGDFELSGQIDRSHHFLYGHRFWPKVKLVIQNTAERPAAGNGGKSANGGVPQADQHCPSASELVALIKEAAIAVAEKLKVERNLINAIAAVGLATLNHVGLDAFRAAPGEIADPQGVMKKSPDVIVAERAKDDSQGLLGFLKTIDKKFSVAFAATSYSGKFPVVNDQQVTHAAAQDRSQDWRAKDDRCWEGPIPVECTAASCGTCWVGVVGGQEKLSEVTPRERRAMNVFGYNQPDEEKPFLRLACQTKAYGNVSLVVPPWNGVFGKKVRGNVEELELEPNTTSAKALRDAVSK